MRYIQILLWLTYTLASCPVLAQDKDNSGTITFTGEITAQTCKAKIDGQNNATVTLPKIRDSQLPKNGSTAGLTLFTLTISDCNYSEDGMQKVTVRLRPSDNKITDGNLDNTTSLINGGAAGVFVQLAEDAEGQKPIKLTSDQYGTPVNLNMNLSNGSASHTFSAQYYRRTSIKTGTAKATLNYTVSYL